jgi:hypothetical protein
LQPFVIFPEKVLEGIGQHFGVFRWHEPAATETVDHLGKAAVRGEHHRRS